MLCDDVVVSVGKNKHNLIGLIGAINVPQLPATIGGFMVYVRGSGVHGDQKIRLVLEDANSGEELMAMEGGFKKTTDPLMMYTLILPFPPVHIERAGKYLFSAKHNGVPFATSWLQINCPNSQAEGESK